MKNIYLGMTAQLESTFWMPTRIELEREPSMRFSKYHECYVDHWNKRKQSMTSWNYVCSSQIVTNIFTIDNRTAAGLPWLGCRRSQPRLAVVSHGMFRSFLEAKRFPLVWFLQRYTSHVCKPNHVWHTGTWSAQLLKGTRFMLYALIWSVPCHLWLLKHSKRVEPRPMINWVPYP